MRLTVLALPLAFLSLVAAHGGAHSHNHPRDVDELSTRDILEDISTRELLDVLSDRLDRRGVTKPKGRTPAPTFQPYNCAYCHLKIETPQYEKSRCDLSSTWSHGRLTGQTFTRW
ncbi:hypothetical protein DFP72DRAFT_1175622 [Ephemerocybe angulata]|uniref:Uncharacterized protein n=1 Tax=Ephemerocybe angulata TaxID=980116 RepID=A0A8H6LWD9_9AGAR|nr:hypothetical protein DFP72DRAFT_1175622 [Tulosesus angulatus]